jgi:ribosome-binding protein aMBF1 (putative translation factor)
MLQMVRKQRPQGRQVHYRGRAETVEEWWKDDLRAAMKKLGWDQKDLAAKIPVSPASITNMFKPGARSIRFKDRIEVLVGWRKDERVEQASRRVAHRVRLLTPENAELIERMIDSLATKP